MPSLLLGAGRDHTKKVHLHEGMGLEWPQPLITVDMDPSCEPTLTYDLTQRPLPFPDNYFDEIGAYDVLEHWGAQGDWKAWFDEFEEYWRLLKPHGYMSILVPIGNDFLADPGHTRQIGGSYFTFLSQKAYEVNHQNGTCMTDYRGYWKRDFDVVMIQQIENHHVAAIIRKVPQ